ncbi:helix-turn-helix domain-containing protein [Blastococcus sp. CT_GayMR20]|uniref:helix-turn-helix domain-containing protein n=1 Tax=Blastococcus sp. CT_GayMR20 TaxID=2559609 RepID=UPI001FD76F3D|nr:helix-turn-helix domain-containing protein [Blastococcus sp. CT_GayMR20]
MARTTYGGATPQAAACGHAPLLDSPQLLTIDQAAEYLGTGQRFVRRLISERRIPYVKLGKHVRLERCALDAFVAAGRVPCR